MFSMVYTLQDFASGGISRSDGTGRATEQQVVLALLYLLKCSTVTVFLMATTAVQYEATFRRMFCPMDRAYQRRRRQKAAVKLGRGHSKTKVTQAQQDSFRFNLAATGYLYLVLLMWDGELALSFEHFLDVNYGPVFFVALLSLVKVAFSIEVNLNTLSGGGRGNGGSGSGATDSSAHRSLLLNLGHTVFVLAFLACFLWKHFEAARRLREEPEEQKQ